TASASPMWSSRFGELGRARVRSVQAESSLRATKSRGNPSRLTAPLDCFARLPPVSHDERFKLVGQNPVHWAFSVISESAGESTCLEITPVRMGGNAAYAKWGPALLPTPT